MDFSEAQLFAQFEREVSTDLGLWRKTPLSPEGMIVISSAQGSMFRCSTQVRNYLRMRMNSKTLVL